MITAIVTRPTERLVTVQLTDGAQSVLTGVMPRDLWESTLRPLLTAGATINHIPFTLQEQP